MSLPIFPSTLVGLTYPVVKRAEFNTIKQQAPNLSFTTVAQTRNPFWSWELIYEFAKQNNPGYTTDTSDYNVLQGFYNSLSGGNGEFLYNDPTDNAVGPAVISSVPNTQAELQILNDGVGNYYSPIQRNMGGQFYEDITDLQGTIAVYSNGIFVSGGAYSIIGPGVSFPGYSFTGLVIQWPSPPAWTVGSKSLGYQILDPAGHIQQVTGPGTTGSTIPVFNDSGGTTTDGTVTWTDQGAAPGPTGPITAEFQFYFRVRFAEDKLGFEQWLYEYWTLGGSNAAGNGSSSLILNTARPNQI